MAKRLGAWRLRDAASRGDTTAVEAMIEDGVEVDEGGEAGRTALHCAAMRGRPDVTRLLLEAGANPNAKTKSGGETPLHQAAEGGFPDIVVELLKAGADWRLQTKIGWTALHCAMYSAHMDVARVLIRAGADPYKANDRGIAPKDVATRADERDVDSILESGKWHQSGESGGMYAAEAPTPDVEKHHMLKAQHIAAYNERSEAAAARSLSALKVTGAPFNPTLPAARATAAVAGVRAERWRSYGLVSVTHRGSGGRAVAGEASVRCRSAAPGA
jgi:ankyrin repeat protein|eukprot:COSAG01_NODE_1485_length_10131_cov_10.500995_10_plen_273_part_00